jgi:hypothetical protein
VGGGKMNKTVNDLMEFALGHVSATPLKDTNQN